MFWEGHLPVSQRRYFSVINIHFFVPVRLFLKTDQYHTEEATVWFTCCVSFFPGQEVVGDKITLGVFSNETDWSQEKIAMKVRH